ncbi:hypothetical protein CCACVL1_02327 [Corchorus capsularis]|uniref:Uncharacterized protein n=1 Tax=Corchorus capsularis TaxID=210143 RepID=A0A1R3K982_COCAP|nr:hypothetical protein CCACVL1_02327 [Corchorus capsularis]
MYDAPFLKKSQSLKLHDTLLDRTIVPVITLVLTATLSIVWYLHRDDLLQRLAPESWRR